MYTKKNPNLLELPDKSSIVCHKQGIKKGLIMKYEPVKYNSREEAVTALRRMIQRKRELEKRMQEEFVKARKEAINHHSLARIKTLSGKE